MQRKKITRLRLSRHRLRLEIDSKSGINRIPPEKLICKHCELNLCENDFHFIMIWPKYNCLRQNFFRSIGRCNANSAIFSQKSSTVYFIVDQNSTLKALMKAYCIVFLFILSTQIICKPLLNTRVFGNSEKTVSLHEL